MMITMTKVGRSYSYNPETFDLQYYLPSTYISPGPPSPPLMLHGWMGVIGGRESRIRIHTTSKGCQQTMYGGWSVGGGGRSKGNNIIFIVQISLRPNTQQERTCREKINCEFISQSTVFMLLLLLLGHHVVCICEWVFVSSANKQINKVYSVLLLLGWIWICRPRRMFPLK